MVMEASSGVVDELCNLRIDVQGFVHPTRTEKVFVADRHAHIDRVFQRQRYQSWQDFEDRKGREFASRIRLDEVVYSANFPDTWDWVERALDRNRTYLTVGLHPHVSSEVIPEKVMRRGAQLLRDSRCVGVGEVGLDYYHHTQERERSLQRSYLHTLLPQVAATSKPLVIHCREHTAESSQARKDLLRILTTHLTPNHPVYVHGFCGDVSARNQWTEAFPQVVFGLGKPLLSSVKLQEAVREMPLDRILVESDAPYQLEHPYLLYEVVYKLAKLLYLSPRMVGELSGHNLRKFFSID